MVSQLNKVLLMGNLTRDPELRRTQGGDSVANLSLAVKTTFHDKDEQKREVTTYVDVTAWGRQAESCSQYLKKGSGVHVEGMLSSRSWDDKKTGEKRTKMEVRADRVQFLDRKEKANG